MFILVYWGAKVLICYRMNCEWSKPFKWKFTNFSVHPSLILQKHFLTEFNLAMHLMVSIVITTLFVFCRTNIFTSCLMFVCSHEDHICKHGLKRFFDEEVFTFIPFNTKLCLTSIGKLGSWLYIKKNGEHFLWKYAC